MKTLLLDGFNQTGEAQARMMAKVTSELDARGWAWEVMVPREMDLAACTGCFGCWTRRPGMCVQEDNAHELCRKIMECELILNVTPVSFGGYSSSAKAALDRTIGLVSPFFTMVGGEVHHKLRYDRMPAMAVLGINHDDCGWCAETFRDLIYRNAINFHPPAMAVDVAGSEDLTGEDHSRIVAGLLDRVVTLPESDLPVRRISRENFAAGSGSVLAAANRKDRSRRVLVLIGSPKGRSTSSSISDELLGRMARNGWQTDALRILPHLKTSDSWKWLSDATEDADLLILISPLYVDSLPAPVTLALERIAQNREKAASRQKQGFMAILNCGFPEDFHNYTGLAIAKQFARETGFKWMGGLALGMGGAIDGRPLAQCGRMVRNLLKALDLTAVSLDRGDPVPAEAVDLMGKPFLPRWLYIAMGNWGWKRRAKKYGVHQELHAKPFQKIEA